MGQVTFSLHFAIVLDQFGSNEMYIRNFIPLYELSVYSVYYNYRVAF